MRTEIFSVAFSLLLQIVAPERHRKAFHRCTGRCPNTRTERKHHNHRRTQTLVSEIVTEVDDTLQNWIVYVDENNIPISSMVMHKDQAVITGYSPIPVIVPTATAPERTPNSLSASTPTPAVEQGNKAPAQNGNTKPVLAPESHSRPSLKPKPPARPRSLAGSGKGVHGGLAAGGLGFASGVTYTPYNADNSCKTESQVAQDLADVNSYQVIRLYGTDCNQVANVMQATKGSVSIFAGIFNIADVQNEVDIIASAVSGNWKVINTISVGNELVNNGGASVGQIISAIGAARSALKARGYDGPVVTVDTMKAMKENPQLCQASDFCAINCHAFFDGEVLPEDAGPYVADWARQVSEAAGGKATVVTESGWPTQGNPNKKAVPSKENHQQALWSLKRTFSDNLVLFGLYNDLWKKDSGETYGAERYWGILGNAPSHH
ncbi:MAG: hypothetical protein Q9163_002552 [Psora crenata]